MNRTEEKQ